jgi:hypothetical protein
MKKLAVLFLTGLLLCACQAAPPANLQQNQTEKPVPDNVPFSKGPTSEPIVTGPSGPPPETSDSTAQAVTTKENIRLTLPTKTEGGN